MIDQKTALAETEKLLPSAVQISASTVETLRDVLRWHEWRYYVKNDPVISDAEYDQLFSKLSDYEEKHPDQITKGSPTQRVGNDAESSFDLVKHLSPMLSLANSYSAEDLIDFDASVKKFFDSSKKFEYTIEPKYDGGSVVLVYENDQLVRAATRGNGQEGEEITENIRALKSVPLYAPFSKYGITRVEIRGEAIISKLDFEKINAQRAQEGLSLFANPRNTATGGLRTKDPEETAARGIVVFLYQISYFEGESLPDSHFERIELLAKLGFKVPTFETKKSLGIEGAVEFCQSWEEERDKYEYELDGMVVKLDSIKLQDQMGHTAHHPRWAIAFKFQAKQATSILEMVDYQIGRIGAITPVAKIKPVSLAGVTISSISLHNEEFITSKDIRLYDRVLIERSGDVIPYIVKSFPDLREGHEKIIEFPKNCPSCGTELVKPADEAVWRCVNPSCEAQILQKLVFHVSKPAMNIDGLGKSQIEKFYHLGWIKNFADIYRLPYDRIKDLEGFGQKSVDNLSASIEKAKSNPLYRLLHSLSIHHVGNKASQLIAQHIDSIFDLQTKSAEDLLDINEIGPVVADNIEEYFSHEENILVLRQMEELGVNMKSTDEDKPAQAVEDGVFSGKTILFTGTLQDMNRKTAQTLAVENGAKLVSAVSGNLDILVVGEKAGSKLKKAQSLGSVDIITESEFIQMTKQSRS